MTAGAAGVADRGLEPKPGTRKWITLLGQPMEVCASSATKKCPEIRLQAKELALVLLLALDLS